MAKDGLDYLNDISKRRLDLYGGSVLVSLAAAPLAGVLAVSALDTRSWPLLWQSRVGRYGETLRVPKARTLPKSLTDGIPLTTFGAHDPRASEIGHYLRRKGYDELPQLIPVVLGSMSLVGPRPQLQEDLDRMQCSEPALFEDWYYGYERVKQGIFGESQLGRRQFENASTREADIYTMQADLRYFAGATLLGDLQIMGRVTAKMLPVSPTFTERSGFLDGLPPDLRPPFETG